MDLYDSSTNSFISFHQVVDSIDQYRFFFDGSEIDSPTISSIKQLISDQSQKASLLVCKKQETNQKNTKIQDIFAGNQFSRSFTENQLQMYKNHPTSLFNNRVWNFQYLTNRSADDGLKEKQEELRHQLITGDQKWKQATLEQLEAVTKNYHKMIEDSLK